MVIQQDSDGQLIYLFGAENKSFIAHDIKVRHINQETNTKQNTMSTNNARSSNRITLKGIKRHFSKIYQKLWTLHRYPDD